MFLATEKVSSCLPSVNISSQDYNYSNHYHHRLVLPDFNLYTSRIIPYLLICVFLLLFNTISVRFIHVLCIVLVLLLLHTSPKFDSPQFIYPLPRLSSSRLGSPRSWHWEIWWLVRFFFSGFQTATFLL